MSCNSKKSDRWVLTSCNSKNLTPGRSRAATPKFRQLGAHELPKSTAPSSNSQCGFQYTIESTGLFSLLAEYLDHGDSKGIHHRRTLLVSEVHRVPDAATELRIGLVTNTILCDYNPASCVISE
jgi:hypothetical protein